MATNPLNMKTIQWPALGSKRIRHHASCLGFTLIELMIAVAIVGLLTALALPSYQKQVLKSHRPDAKAALLDLASREERYRSTNQSYTSTGTSLGYGSNFPINVPSATSPSYSITVTTSNGGVSYTATATPLGSQSRDSCGTYTITDTGAQSASQSNCW
jgi:type IV pilus assembly protein PilE